MPVFEFGTNMESGWMRMECSDRDFARTIAIKLFGWDHFTLKEVPAAKPEEL